MPETAPEKLGYRQRLYSRYVTDFQAHHLHVDDAVFEQQVVTLRKRFAGVLPVDRTAHILDVACGSGGFLYFLRNAGYVNILGIDVTCDAKEVKKAAAAARDIKNMSGTINW